MGGRVIVAVNGGAFAVADLIYNMNVASIRRHYELACGGGCVQGLHARCDHLEVVKVDATMADLVHT